MKSRIFKNLMMPLAVMVLGAAGAFATTSMADAKAVVNQQGYRFVSNADPCHADLMCRTEFGDICKSGTITLWGKVTPSATNCDVQLYKIPN